VALTYRKPVIARVDPILSVGVYLLVLSIMASYTFNPDRFDLITMFGNIGSAILLFVALYTIVQKIELDFRRTLLLQCLCALPLFPLIVAGSHDQWGRMMPAELTPNYVGMMALVAFIGACSAGNLLLTLVLSLIPLYVIGVMQSRDSMLSAGVAGLALIYCHLRRLGWKKLRPYALPAFVVVPIVVIGLYFAGIDLFGYVANQIADLFLINDEHRGIESGGSGRTDLWAAAFNLWLTHPVFGVGFKAHPLLMPGGMLAHNAYLGMLADLGTVGFIAYMLILFSGFYYVVKRGNRLLTAYPERVAILLSYIVYGMLESRAFSFGNTYSLLFLLVVFDSSKHRVQPNQKIDVQPSAPSTAQSDHPEPVGLVTRSKV
jgi:O-antigen ligase